MPRSRTRARSNPFRVSAPSSAPPAATLAGASCAPAGADSRVRVLPDPAALAAAAALARSAGLGCVACSATRPRHTPAETRASQLLCRSSVWICKAASGPRRVAPQPEVRMRQVSAAQETPKTALQADIDVNVCGGRVHCRATGRAREERNWPILYRIVCKQLQEHEAGRRTRLSRDGSCEGCALAMPLTCSAAALRSSAVEPAACLLCISALLD